MMISFWWMKNLILNLWMKIFRISINYQWTKKKNFPLQILVRINSNVVGIGHPVWMVINVITIIHSSNASKAIINYSNLIWTIIMNQMTFFFTFKYVSSMSFWWQMSLHTSDMQIWFRLFSERLPIFPYVYS